jgi:dynein intermediate chain
VITYSKAVQTTDAWEPQRHARDTGSGGEEWSDEDDASRTQRKEKENEATRQKIREEIEAEIRAAQESMKLDGEHGPERFPLRNLTDEELEAVTSSREFNEFVDQSSKVIERALDEKYDVLMDYAQGNDNLDDDEDAFGKGRNRRGRRVKQVAQYWDGRWSKKRMISDLAFSPKVIQAASAHPPQSANGFTVSRIAPRIIHLEPFRPPRSCRTCPAVELSHAHSAGIRIPC